MILIYLIILQKLFPKSYLCYVHIRLMLGINEVFIQKEFEVWAQDNRQLCKRHSLRCRAYWPWNNNVPLLLGSSALVLCVRVWGFWEVGGSWSKKWRLWNIWCCLHLSEQCDTEGMLQAAFYNLEKRKMFSAVWPPEHVLCTWVSY